MFVSLYDFFLFAMITNVLVWADVEASSGHQDDGNVTM